MLKVDLPDDELAAVVAALRKVIGEDKFPLSPRLKPLKSVLAKAGAPAGKEATTAAIGAGRRAFRFPRLPSH
jgi:hypothetical protein